ncbi:hypothetical protein MKZ38_008658 [Zalerion maritima]|uniref:Uncharacterized protein n=1 Tax=Zalerion maritima TaxID=339359 RepID=A0AAD5RGX0_9PEZI|nr:hypothetical protein MKZ38_008658 [Zalerion maritima]
MPPHPLFAVIHDRGVADEHQLHLLGYNPGSRSSSITLSGREGRNRLRQHIPGKFIHEKLTFVVEGDGDGEQLSPTAPLKLVCDIHVAGLFFMRSMKPGRLGGSALEAGVQELREDGACDDGVIGSDMLG